MCGIVGLIGSPDAASEAFIGLNVLQHRGQDAAGILTYDHDGFHRVKNLGLVESVFTSEKLAGLKGHFAIGHARYSTIGRGDLGDVQPFILNYPFGIGMAHNGNIVNCAQLGGELKSHYRRHLLTHSDTEVVLNLFAEKLARTSSGQGLTEFKFDDICHALKEVFHQVNGSYSIVSLIAGQGLVAFRDPYGIRPLVWGRRAGGELASRESHIVASESVVLSFLGYDVVRHIQPGEVLFIDLQGNVHTRVLDQREHRPCMFEWVYFASPESEIDGVPVYGSRIHLGKALSRLVRDRVLSPQQISQQIPSQMKEKLASKQIQPDIVVPIPETSRIAAISLAEDLGIPYREVLIKNRYIKRTFILNSQEKRQSAVNLKLSPVRSEIEGKKVLLIDDSIVRGTTSKKIVELVRQAGAAAVYLVSTCPPIQHPCYYGIDFPVESELIASGRSLAEIEKLLGVDALIYQDLEGLHRSIVEASGNRVQFNPCMACLNGKYPTDVSCGRGFAAARMEDRKN